MVLSRDHSNLEGEMKTVKYVTAVLAAFFFVAINDTHTGNETEADTNN